MTKILQTMMAKFLGQKAAIRPQNISLKATAAKRPHFAHGWSRVKIDRKSAVPTLLSGGYWPPLYRRACEVDPSLLDNYTHEDSLSLTPSTKLPHVAPSSSMKLSVTEHEHQTVCATPSARGTLPHMTFLSPVTTSESRATTPVSRAVTPTSLLYPVTPSISGATTL